MTSNKQFKELMESVNSSIVVIQNDKLVYINDYAADRIGLPKSKIIDRHFLDFVPPDSQKIAQNKISELVFNKITIKGLKAKFLNGKGEVRLTEINAAPTNFDNSPATILSIRDITEIRKSEKELRRKELFQESLLNASSNVIYIYDLIEQKNVYSNKSVGAVLGYSVEEIKKFDSLIKDLMHPVDFNNYIENIYPSYQNLLEGDLLEHEYRMKRKNGEWKWFLSKESIYNRDDKGNATQIFGILSDITEKKNIRILLETKERQMQSIYDDPNMFIGVLDINGRAIDANKTALNFIGKTFDDVKGKKFWDTPWWSHSKKQQELLKSAYKKALKGSSASFNAEHIGSDGELVVVNFSIRPMKDTDGKIFNFLVEGNNITEQVIAEQGLRESEQRYRALSENAPVGVWNADLKGNVTYINPKLSEISGLSVEEATSGKWGSKVHPEDKERVLNEWDEYIANDKPYTSTYRFIQADGKVQWVLENATTIYDSNKIKIAHIGTITDINEKVFAEERILETSKRYQNLFDSSPIAMWDEDFTDLFKYLNILKKRGIKDFRRYFKRYPEKLEKCAQLISITDVSQEAVKVCEAESKEDLIGNLERIFTPISYEIFLEEVLAFINGDTFFEYESELLTFKGKKLNIILRANIYEAENKRITGIISVIDITSRLKNEADLRFQSELIKQSYESMITTDLDFKISWTNKAFTDLFGYTREEVLGKTPDFLNAEPLAEEIQQNIYNNMKDGKLLKSTLLNKKKDGSTFVCEVAVYPVLDKNGEIIAYSGHQYDITERVTAEKELEDSENRFRSIFDNSSIGIATVSDDGKPMFVNDALCKMLGYPQKELQSMTFVEFTYPEDAQKDIDLYIQLVNGEISSYNMEKRYLHKNGDIVWGMLTVSSVRDSEGKMLYAIGMVDDITKDKKNQLELEVSEKKYHDLFEHQIEAYAYHEIILNKKGKAVDYRFIDVNDQFLKELNLKHKKDVIGKTLFELDPNIDNKWVKYYGEVALTGKPKKFEDKFTHNDKWYKIYAYSPRQGHFATSFIDITDEKKAEQEIKESEERFRSTFESVGDGIILIDRDGKVLYANEALFKMVEIGEKDLLGKHVLPAAQKTSNVDQIPNIIKNITDALNFKQIKPFEVIYNNKTFKINVNFNKNNKNIIGILQDVTDEKKAEREIKESEERFRSTFESVSEGVILVEKDGRVLYVNESLSKMTNLDGKDLVGKHAIALAKKMINAKQLPTTLKNITAALSYKKFRPFEVDYNNRTFRVSIAFNKINRNIIGILQDITDDKKAEIELHEHREHLEELVERRTKDLKKKNEELDNALKVFVGRELTIKNLRNEISKLEKELKLLKN